MSGCFQTQKEKPEVDPGFYNPGAERTETFNLPPAGMMMDF